MITIDASPLDKAGRQLLRLTRALFTLPVRDGLADAVRDLTTIPAVRLSRVLEPFCRGTRTVEPRKAREEPGRHSEWGMLSREPARGTPAVADAVRIERRPGSAAVAGGPRHEAPPHVGVPHADAAPVLRAMKVLNLSVHRGPIATGRPAEQWSVRHPPKRSGFVRDPHETAAERERTAAAGRGGPEASVGGDARADEGGGLRRVVPESEPVAPVSGAGSRTPAPNVRMAQGVAGIAALLQANLVAISLPGGERLHEPGSALEKESDETAEEGLAEDPPAAAASQVDMEYIADRLADHLELELIRTYGARLK